MEGFWEMEFRKVREVLSTGERKGVRFRSILDGGSSGRGSERTAPLLCVVVVVVFF